MPDRLLAAAAQDLALSLEPVPDADVVSGTPCAGSQALDEVDEVEVGLWEITEGAVRDVEVDEVFVVLSGSGAVTFEDGERLDLAPGTVVRLREGERTLWEITAALRKVYVARG